jgi:hypothetical protein
MIFFLFSGKSTIFLIARLPVNFYEEDVRFLSKGNKNLQDPFFKKAFLILGAIMSSLVSSV